MEGTAKTYTPFAASEKIPTLLKENNRWAPWRAEWDAKRGKHDKIPLFPHNLQRRLSSANPTKWVSFKAAMAAFSDSMGYCTGVGYVVTGPHGIIGIDLDDAVEDSVVDPWAQEIVERVGGYAEFSPSGTGLRIFVLGDIENDWTNHNAGVEVYAGHQPRFLTLTGRHLPGTPADVVAPNQGALQWLAEKYRENAAEKKANGSVPDMPLVLSERDTPDISELGLPLRNYDFLTSGEAGTDRSRVLHSTAVALFSAGLTDAEVFSILVNNPYSFEVALDHRRQIDTKAMDYLWEHHVCAAKSKAASKILTAADWEEIEAQYDERAEDADDLAAPEKPNSPKARFRIDTLQDFCAAQARQEWQLRHLLPRTGVVSVIGQSGHGKSFFVLDMAMHAAAGQDFYGRKAQREGANVVMGVLEGVNGWRDRVKAYSKQRGLPTSPGVIEVLTGSFDLRRREDVQPLIAHLRSKGSKTGLFVVDTLAQATPGANENSSEDMGAAMAHAKLISEMTGWVVVIVAHLGKNKDLGQRGWSGMKGAMDVEITVSKGSSHYVAEITKLKDAPGERDRFFFEIEDVELGFDPEFGRISAGVAVPIAQGGAMPELQAQARPRRRRSMRRGQSWKVVSKSMCSA